MKDPHVRSLVIILSILCVIALLSLVLTLPAPNNLAGQSSPLVAQAGKGVDDVPRKDSRDPEIKEFIARYFRTWSNQDMEGYDACFMPEATIQYIAGEGQLSTQLRPDFIESQRQHHRTAAHRATEVAESVNIRYEEKLARVVVYWKLTAGPRTEYGYDHFTLMKHEKNWRIVNLVFYQTR
jgi:hypothetical protein